MQKMGGLEANTQTRLRHSNAALPRYLSIILFRVLGKVKDLVFFFCRPKNYFVKLNISQLLIEIWVSSEISLNPLNKMYGRK